MAGKDTPTMDWASPNLVDAFNMFKQRINLFFMTRGVTQAEHKVAHILLQIGEEGLRRYNSLTLSEEDKKNPATILQKIEEQLKPAENFRVSRLRLMGLRQTSTESIDSFVTRAKEQAKTCDFEGDEADQRIIELIIAGTSDDDYRKELLTKPKTYKLDEALQLGRQYEATASHVKELHIMKSCASGGNIDAFKQRVPFKQIVPCKNCGGKHKPKSCPAFGTRCSSCGKPNHWAKVCRSGAAKPGQQRQLHQRQQQGNRGADRRTQRRVNEVEVDHELEDTFETLSFQSIQVSSVTSHRDEAYAKLSIKLPSRPGTHNLSLKVDTGAQGNTIPLRLFREMFPDQVGKNGFPSKKLMASTSGVRLTAYNGTNIPCYGLITIPCKYLDSQWEHTMFYIVDVPGPAVLGLPSSENLRVVTMHCSVNSSQPASSAQTQKPSINTVNDLKQLYPEQFDRIGKLPGPVKLVTSPDVPSHVDAPRKTPIALKDAIKAELDTME